MSNKGNNSTIIFISIIIIIFFGLMITDFIRIYNFKKDLKTVNDMAVELLYQDLKEEEIYNYLNKDLDSNFITYEVDYKEGTMSVTRAINIWTPGLNLLLGNPYKVTVSEEIFLE